MAARKGGLTRTCELCQCINDSAMLKIAMNDVTHVNTFIQYGGLYGSAGRGHP
jgi:hypothetical protein